jgi:hypothetical protein
MFTDRPASVGSKEVTTIGGCLRFELVYRQKEKGGVELLPFELLPNCFISKSTSLVKKNRGVGQRAVIQLIRLDEHRVRDNSGELKLTLGQEQKQWCFPTFVSRGTVSEALSRIELRARRSLLSL